MKNRVLLVIKSSDLEKVNKIFYSELKIIDLFDFGYGDKESSNPKYYFSTLIFSQEVDQVIRDNESLFVKIIGYTGSIDLTPIKKELDVERISILNK